MKYDLTGRVQSGLLLLDFSTILKSVIAELALCLKKLCERYVTFQEAEMLELSYKIKFPIVMNIDYLHEHRCKKHR